MVTIIALVLDQLLQDLVDIPSGKLPVQDLGFGLYIPSGSVEFVLSLYQALCRINNPNGELGKER